MPYVNNINYHPFQSTEVSMSVELESSKKGKMTSLLSTSNLDAKSKLANRLDIKTTS